MPSKDQSRKKRLTGRNVCPYHRYYTSSRIACEMYRDESCAAIEHLVFDSKEQLVHWRKMFCSKRFRDCPRYKRIKNKE